MNQIILISGATGSGHLDVALALCERFDRMMLIDTDELRGMIKAGFRYPWHTDKQSIEQDELNVMNASAIALNACSKRYSAIIVDSIFSEKLEWYKKSLAGTEVDIQFITLMPQLNVIEEKLLDSPLLEYSKSVHKKISAEIEAKILSGLVIDNSNDLTPSVTADKVQDAIARGLALLDLSN